MPYHLSNSSIASTWTTQYWPSASGSISSYSEPHPDITTITPQYKKPPCNSTVVELSQNSTTSTVVNSTLALFRNCSTTAAPVYIPYNTSLIFNSTVYQNVTQNVTLTPLYSNVTVAEPTTTTLSTITVRSTVSGPETPAPPLPPGTVTTTKTPVVYTTVVKVPTELTSIYCVTTVITSHAHVTTVKTKKFTTTTKFVDKTTTVETCPESKLPTPVPTTSEEPTTTYSVTMTQTFTVDGTTVPMNPVRHSKNPVPRPFAQTQESIGLPEVPTPEPEPVPVVEEPHTPPAIPNPPPKTFSLSPAVPIYPSESQPALERAPEPTPEPTPEWTPAPTPSSTVTVIAPHTSRPLAIGHNGGSAIVPSVALLFLCHLAALHF